MPTPKECIEQIAELEVNEGTFKDHLEFISALIDRAHSEVSLANLMIEVNGGLGDGKEAQVVRLQELQLRLARTQVDIDYVITTLPWPKEN